MKDISIIGNLNPVLPKSWKKVCLRALIDDDSYEITFYVYLENKSTPVQCYNLPKYYKNISEKDIDKVFERIAKILRSYKRTNCQYTYVYTSDGKEAWYDVLYFDDKLDNYMTISKWKQKYLTESFTINII